jgi:hypothetical protein
VLFPQKICTSGPPNYALRASPKNMHFCSPICTFGPPKNTPPPPPNALQVPKKYALLASPKNMHFLVCRKIVLLVSGEIVPLVSGGNSRGGVRLPCPSPPFNATGARAPPGSLPGIPGARGGVNVVLGRRAGEERGYLCMALSCLIRARRRVDAPRPSHRPSSTWTCLWLWSLWSVQAVVT